MTRKILRVLIHFLLDHHWEEMDFENCVKFVCHHDLDYATSHAISHLITQAFPTSRMTIQSAWVIDCLEVWTREDPESAQQAFSENSYHFGSTLIWDLCTHYFTTQHSRLFEQCPHPRREKDMKSTTNETTNLEERRRDLLQVVEYLLSHGADVEKGFVRSNFVSLTPLSIASSCGHLETVKLLLQYGAQPFKFGNIYYQYECPLYEALNSRHFQVFQELCHRNYSCLSEICWYEHMDGTEQNGYESLIRGYSSPGLIDALDERFFLMEFVQGHVDSELLLEMQQYWNIDVDQWKCISRGFHQFFKNLKTSLNVGLCSDIEIVFGPTSFSNE
ncbi:hypothetical protein C9374_005209 [Naegleria lovaniensis]|uniref:Uncharacterized protein n=1 Tax=Naegleria lovaniensis TaxID=51637 RepID=A0AA88GP36_NAELO|nr:uncharacterized protein C9374_005209 [Naegleria lovaniensis]KAG2382629.1 hypothetical protein C9374_005209 [Naegleria lovaniensis]